MRLSILPFFAATALAFFNPAPVYGETVRLALISESEDTSAVSDVLTADLSKEEGIQLLERNQIERVYREQGLSAQNTDYIKLGRILGADGLLLLGRSGEGTNQFLNVRLVAVNPGVVLAAERFPWPIKDLSEWSSFFTQHVKPLLPKCRVLAKDAIPVSVVNLHSAIQSDEEQEMEQQLKLLTLQRLSREPQLFVLERQKMQLMDEEKNLKADDSAFWDGSYLLEGTIDQNGYSTETVTINARLVPPKGAGAPLLFEVTGNRSNLSDVVNALSVKVSGLLKINPAKEWSAPDEANRFFEEAKWDLSWGLVSEAESAVDSAWALGKRDLDCASVRVKAGLAGVSADIKGFRNSEATYSGGTDVNGKPYDQPFSPERIAADVKRALAQYPPGTVYQMRGDKFITTVTYTFITGMPDSENIGKASRVLEFYYNFSRTSPAMRSTAGKTNQPVAEWNGLGIQCLTVASRVLQNFYFLPEAQKPVADQLAGLRAVSRSVAQWLLQRPSVQENYFIGDRLATHDELAHSIPPIFYCELKWGCFWQDTPEDCVRLYRELMGGPAFCYLHEDFWIRNPENPRITAWTDADRKQMPAVWGDFIHELDNSTNVFFNAEANALRLADADTEFQTAKAFTNFFESIFEHHDAFVTNNVEVLYLNWGADRLVQAKTGGRIVSVPIDRTDALRRLFYDDYRPRLEAMDREYWDKTIPAYKLLAQFDSQKQYLADFTPFNFFTFNKTFSLKNYTKAQAAELRPLIEAYKSNLLEKASSPEISGREKFEAENAKRDVEFFLERTVNNVLDAPASPPTFSRAGASPPVAARKTAAAVSVVTNAPPPVTNAMVVNRFFAIPFERLLHSDFDDPQHIRITITAHHIIEGRLLLDFQYTPITSVFGPTGNRLNTEAGSAIAVFNPTDGSWDVIGCPPTTVFNQNNFYHRTTLLHGQLFHCDGGQIQQYDAGTGQWETLSVSDGNNYELFAVNGRLYAANKNVIFEIADEGKSSRILASNRRQPPASALDTEPLSALTDQADGPTLFAGNDGSLRIRTKDKIFTQVGDTWRPDFAAPPNSFPPEIFADGILFRSEESAMRPLEIFSLVNGGAPQLCFFQKQRQNTRDFAFRPSDNAGDRPQPAWQLPDNLFLISLPAALRRGDLYLLADHSEIQTVANDEHLIVRDNVLAKDGYHAVLYCFSKDLTEPQKIFLKFDSPDGWIPLTGIDPVSRNVFPRMPSAWMTFSMNFLFFGLEAPRGSPPNEVERLGIGCKPGIWSMPVSELDAAVGAGEKAQREKLAHAQAAVEQRHEGVVKKYDQNNDGIIGLSEKEDALADPAFIEFKINEIDSNRNGLLDAEELAWFDANTNKILDAIEKQGIQNTQDLLATNLLKKFDENGDDILDQQEFAGLWQSTFAANRIGMPPVLDTNRDQKVDAEELKVFLERETRNQVRQKLMQKGVSPGMMSSNPKALIELYWQKTLQ